MRFSLEYEEGDAEREGVVSKYGKRGEGVARNSSRKLCATWKASACEPRRIYNIVVCHRSEFTGVLP